MKAIPPGDIRPGEYYVIGGRTMPRFQWKMEIEPRQYDMPGDTIAITIKPDHNYGDDHIMLEVRDEIPGETASVSISPKEAMELIAVLQRAIMAVKED